MLTFFKRLVFYGILANLLWHTFFVEPPYKRNMRQRAAEARVVKPTRPKKVTSPAPKTTKPTRNPARIDFLGPMKGAL